MNLTGPKTAKISNKGLQPTTHKLSAMHTESHATQLSGIVRGSKLNPDVRIKESALRMTKRAISGKISTGDAQRAALPLEKPLLFVYNHSTATNRAENARKTEESGPYGPVFAISRTFSKPMNLTGPKTAKNSNKAFHLTAHNLPSHPYRNVLCFTAPNTLLCAPR